MNSSSVTKETRYRSLDDKICAHVLCVKKVRFFMAEALATNADLSFFELFFSVTSINNLEAYH